MPQQARVQVSHKGIKTAIKFQRIRCTICFTSPDNHQKEKTTPESREPAWYLCHDMMQCSCKSCCKNGGFWQFRTVSLWQTGISARKPWDYRSSETHRKRWITERPTVSLYLMNYWIKMCKFGSQVSQHWPQLGLPQMALWHHVGVTIGITLDKNGSLYDPAGTESWNMQIRVETTKLIMHPTKNRRSASAKILRKVLMQLN